MALSRIQTAIAYAAHGKVVTSVQLDTAGINNNFLHTALPPVPKSMLPPNRKQYSGTALGFQTAEKRWTARDDVGRGWGLKPGKRGKPTVEETFGHKKITLKPLHGPHYYEGKTRCRRHNGRLHRTFIHCARGEPKWLRSKYTTRAL